MAGKTIAKAQQAHDAKHSKKVKDKSKEISKGTAGIIQSGSHAYIVDADGNTHEIISSTSSTATISTVTVDSTHFLQTDDLDSIDPLILKSMCSADIDEYTHMLVTLSLT